MRASRSENRVGPVRRTGPGVARYGEPDLPAPDRCRLPVRFGEPDLPAPDRCRLPVRFGEPDLPAPDRCRLPVRFGEPDPPAPGRGWLSTVVGLVMDLARHGGDVGVVTSLMLVGRQLTLPGRQLRVRPGLSLVGLVLL